jgi:hypothetical protein
MSIHSRLAEFIDARAAKTDWSTHCVAAKVTGQSADHSISVTFDDKNFPDCSNLRWLGGVDMSVSVGDTALVAIDANGSPWIIGIQGAAATEPVPLGNQLVSYIGNIVSIFNSHTHVVPGVTAGAASVVAQQTLTTMSDPSGILSSKVKVQS